MPCFIYTSLYIWITWSILTIIPSIYSVPNFGRTLITGVAGIVVMPCLAVFGIHLEYEFLSIEV